MTQRSVRCAIYTRKSTDEVLDQDFNSLDAQREACEAFIQSQKALGWAASSKRYDDGGFSGGTMERPVLKGFLVDIEKGKVDLVVVYKVDRLTRSLPGFAELVEAFDSHEVSFVSVTQQFNTTTSMGRLTLNVLLSFAQFEREVTAERIRDKIAASKRKGMWMGGLPPLGYDARNKQLEINEEEAGIVRALFRLYLELGTVAKLQVEAKRLGLRTARAADEWRLPAAQLEELVGNSIACFLKEEQRLIDELGLGDETPGQLAAVIREARIFAEQSEAPFAVLQRVTVKPTELIVELNRPVLLKQFKLQETTNLSQGAGSIRVSVPINLKRRGVEAKLVVRAKQENQATPDPDLLTLLGQAHNWFEQIQSGEAKSARTLTLGLGVDPADLGRTIQLVFLAPDITEAILSGQQPIKLTPRRLKRVGMLPLDWAEQRQLLVFPAH